MSTKRIVAKRKAAELLPAVQEIQLVYPRSKEDEREEKRQRIYMAFAEYKERFGDCKVRENFRIDANDLTWPAELRGINLGKVLDNMRYQGCYRDIHPALTELGVTLTRQHASPNFQKIFEALVAYKHINNSVKVNIGFVVPEGDHRYPESTWGLKLGTAVNNIRHYNYYSAHHAELQALGFNLTVNKRRPFETILAALVVYKHVNGNLDVPMKYIVPEQREYPEDTWGMNLGTTLQGIKAGKSYSKYRADLESIGIEFKEGSYNPGTAASASNNIRNSQHAARAGVNSNSSSSSSSAAVVPTTATTAAATDYAASVLIVDGGDSGEDGIDAPKDDFTQAVNSGLSASEGEEATAASALIQL